MKTSGAPLAFAVFLVAAVLAAACTPTAASRPAASGAPAVSFAGKTVTILVPYTVGGGADIKARQVAPFMGKHLPGEPAVIVQNMPGGAGLVGMNWFYNAAPKDGTVLSQWVFTGAVYQTLFSPDQVKYDMAKLRWLGGISDASVAFVHTSLGIKSAEELPGVAQKIFMGDTGPEAGRSISARLFLRLLEKEFQFVSGYGSSSDARAAIRRGELNMTSDVLAGYFQAVKPMVEEGVVVPLAQTGIFQDGKVVRDPRVPDIPTYTELLVKLKGEAVQQTPEFRAIVLLAAIAVMVDGWVYMPGVPEATFATMAQAFDRMLADPELEKTIEESTGLRPRFLSRPQAQQIADSVGQLLEKDSEAVETVRRDVKEARPAG